MTYNIALFEVSLSFHSMSILFSADYKENLSACIFFGHISMVRLTF